MAVTDVEKTDRPHLIDVAELRSRRSEVLLLDVRSGAEFQSVHIPGAYHVPLDTLGEHCSEIGGVDNEVVLICQAGPRAEQASRKLAANGMTSMRVLDGGMNAWTSAGGEVVRGTEKWALERQVRLVAGSLVLTGILGSTVVPKAKWLAGGIGFGLTFSALSNTCAMGNLLSRLPYNQGTDTDVAATIDALVCGSPAPA